MIRLRHDSNIAFGQYISFSKRKIVQVIAALSRLYYHPFIHFPRSFSCACIESHGIESMVVAICGALSNGTVLNRIIDIVLIESKNQWSWRVGSCEVVSSQIY